MDLIYALTIGITSAFIYSLIQELYMHLKWMKTRRLFLRNIRNTITYLDYHVINILDINPIYGTEFETDHLMTHEEFISEIENIDISDKEYKRLNKLLTQTRDKIKETRKEALIIPIFDSKDFHAVDEFIMKINIFLSSYPLFSEDISKYASNRLKKKLIDVLNVAEENPFPNNFLDKINNWKTRKVFKIKNRYKKYIQKFKNKKIDELRKEEDEIF